MTRHSIALVLAACLLFFSPFSVSNAYNIAYANEIECALTQKYEFTMPASLLTIEDEAFEGVAVKTVILPDGFLFIGESAFGDSIRLENVYIPESTTYIADSAFSNNASFTIYGIADSYAEDWAKEHDIPFEKTDIWRHILHQRQQLHGSELKIDVLLWTLDPFEPDRTEKDTQDDNRSYRVEDRPEFHPIDYRFP